MTKNTDATKNTVHNNGNSSEIQNQETNAQNSQTNSSSENKNDRDIPYKGLNPYTEADTNIFFGRENDIQEVVNNLMAWRLTILYGKSGVGKSSILRAGVTHILHEEVEQNRLDYKGLPKLAVVVFPPLDGSFSWNDDNPLISLTNHIEATISECDWGIKTPEPGLSFVETLRDWTDELGGEDEDGELFLILDQFEDYFLYHANESAEGTFYTEFPRAVNFPNLRVNFLISIRDDSWAKLDHFKRYIPDWSKHTVEIKHLDWKSAYQAIKEPIKVYNNHVPSNKSVKIKSMLIKSILEGVNQFSPMENGRAGVEKPESKTKDFSKEPNLPKDLAKEEYDLNVISLNNAEFLPSERENLVIVAKVVAKIGDSYHLRIFDKNGKKVIDKGDDEFLPDESLAQELDIALSKQIISDQTKIELIGKITSILDHAPSLQIEAPYLQLVMTRLWEEMNPTSRCLDLELLMKFADKRFKANKKIQSAIKKIARNHLETALNSLRSKEQDIVANVFQYLVTPSGTKYAYSLSDLSALYDNYVSDSDDKEELKLKCTKSELATLLEKLAKGEKRVICPRPPLPNKQEEGRRFEIFHDVLAQPILDWRRCHLARRQREQELEDARKQHEQELEKAKQLRIRLIKQGLAAQSLQQLRRRQNEIAALLACQAYCHNQQDDLLILEQVDDALRQALNVSHFSHILIHLASGFDWSGSFSSIAFNSDGTKLAAACMNSNIYLWDRTETYSEFKLLDGHDKGVTAITFSLDGAWLVSASEDGTIKKWDLHQKQPSPIKIGNHEEGVTSIAFSPDGILLASGSKDQRVKLWNWHQPEQATIVLMGHDVKRQMGAVHSLAFSPDGSMLAVATDNPAICLWDIAEPAQASDKEPDMLYGHQNKIRSVAFSPDGQFLASGSDDHTIRLWKTGTTDPPEERSKILPGGHKAKVRSLTFSSDGQMLASGSDDQTIRLWKIEQPDKVKAPQIMRGHTFNINSVAFSPDDQILASGAWDNTVRLWDLDPPVATPKILAKHQNTVRAIAISQQDQQERLLASGSEDGTVRVWNLKRLDARLRKTFEGCAKVFGVALFISRDRQVQLLATGSDDQVVRLWDLQEPSDKPLREFTGHQDGVSSVAFSPDGQWLASGSWKNDATVRLWNLDRLWDLDQAAPEPIIFKGDKGHTDSVTSVKFSPDRTLLASASDDKRVLLWNIEQPDADPIELKNHNGRVWSIAFSPDGKYLASASDDWTVRLWDLEKLDLEHPDPKKLVHVVLKGHSAWVSSVAFSPDGKVLASGSFDRSIRLWQLDQIDWEARKINEYPIVLENHNQSVTSIAFTPDGNYLASGSFDNTVRLSIASTDMLSEMVCQKVLRNLTMQEWEQFMRDDIPYELTCPDLPPGEGTS